MPANQNALPQTKHSASANFTRIPPIFRQSVLWLASLRLPRASHVRRIHLQRPWHFLSNGLMRSPLAWLKHGLASQTGLVLQSGVPACRGGPKRHLGTRWQCGCVVDEQSILVLLPSVAQEKPEGDCKSDYGDPTYRAAGNGADVWLRGGGRWGWSCWERGLGCWCCRGCCRWVWFARGTSYCCTVSLENAMQNLY